MLIGSSATFPPAAAGSPDWIVESVVAGGGMVVDDPSVASGVVWPAPRDPEGLAALLDAHPELEWVQLPWAGIEPYVEVVRAHPDLAWTCGKGVYAEPVAEHALGLALAGLRHIGGYARLSSWGPPVGRNLLGARVVVLGGGGITESFLRLLGPFGARTTVVRRNPAPVPGADRVVGTDELDEVIEGADLLVLALALTPETVGIVDRRRMRLLADHAWIVNVARGRHVVTDDLVAALAAGEIGGAALDVTDPEPLPEGHPLWRELRCLITPHIANTPEMAVPLLSQRVRTNVARWIAGEDLIGRVDVEGGY